VLPIVVNHPRNVFTLLGGAFRMRVSEEASELCPPQICPHSDSQEASIGNLLADAAIVYEHVVAPPAIEDDLRPTNQTLGPFADEGGRLGRNVVLHNLGGGGRPARFADWLEAIDSSRRPTLYFKHVLLPHVPWEYLPDGRRYSTDPHGNIHDSTDERSFGDRWLLEQAYQRHLLQARYTDALLGALLDRLRDKGIYDRALVVITADNGAAGPRPAGIRRPAGPARSRSAGRSARRFSMGCGCEARSRSSAAGRSSARAGRSSGRAAARGA
jgi:Sulfatase